ncbi:MAG TPA: Ig-like domain-containing protein, partial [Symbiobacteriaceae bacterium]|nr:Ig-like domain-containing protein [Symbiobacteriaceae bacterium]
MRKKWMIPAAVLLILAIAGGAFWYGRSRPAAPQPGTPLSGSGGPAEVTLRAVKADVTGVDAAGGFVLTSEKPLQAAAVKQYLAVEPAVDLNVEAKSSKEFVVKPAAALEANRIYRFKLAAAAGLSRPYQWSFQTRAAFRVVGTLPRNQGSGVPVNTGIELIFSHENYADPGSLFSISPAVEGRFERHKKTLAFVPKDPLKPGTIYTVTLKQGLKQTGADGKLTSDLRFSFETAPEGTDPKAGARQALSVPEQLLEYPAGEAPYFLVYSNDLAKPLQVTVHRYKDATAFAAALAEADQVPWWANWGRSQYKENTAALTQVAAFEGRLKEYEQFGTYLHVPEALPAGYYIATLRTADQGQQQIHFQVTDLSSYAALSTTNTLVWLNDLATGKPVAGAKVSVIGGGAPVSTGTDGVALLPPVAGAADMENHPGVYLHAQAGGKEAVVAVPWDRYYNRYYYGGSASTQALQYWRYLYLDRQLYKPDDTVNLWGVGRPREPGAKPVSEVTAVVTRGGYYDAADQPAPLAKAVLPVREATYTGSLELPGLKPGWYAVEIRSGDEVLSSRYFEVQAYVKPAYRVDAELSKRAVFAGDPVELTVKASFFEGTPVPNLPLAFSMNKDGQNLVTGPDGRATATLNPTGYGYAHGAESMWYSVHATLPEAGEIGDSGYLMVYSRDVLLESDVAVENGQAVVTGQINRVTLDALNAGDSWDVKGAPVAGREVTVVLTEQNWDKIEKGTYYDFIAKTTNKQYDYVPNHKQVGTFSTMTRQDGGYTLTLPINPEKSYEVTVSAADNQSRAISRQMAFSGREYQAFRDSLTWWRWYNLAPVSGGTGPYGLGQPVTLELRREQSPVPDRPAGFLFYTARLGLREYKVQSGGRYTYALKEPDLPATTVGAVVFDGRSYYEANGYTLRFDPQERALKVAVKSDRASYKPGDTVNLTISAADLAGKPVRAQVNLNLVDEAVYALRDQEVNLLGSLYGDYMPTGILRTRRSHQVPRPNSMAEK